MDPNTVSVIGVALSLAGTVGGYLAFARNRSADAEAIARRDERQPSR